MYKHIFTAIIIFLLGHFSLIAQPQKVSTGVYLLNLYDMNMDEHSFYADFYIWFKWKGDIDPTNIEFVNMVEKWGQTQASFSDSTTTLKDGSQYKIMRIEGRFFHSFSLGRFPIDEHVLDIQFENPDYPIDKLVYVPDSAHIRNTLNLVGWEMKGCTLQSSEHDYKVDFGNPDEKASLFSNISFGIVLGRPFTYFALKMMLPLIVVMLVSIGALLLHPSYIDTRSQLPIGALLTAVFLQQSYSSALPDTGYMVLMDKIYLLCYILISIVLLQVIIAGNKIVSGTVGDVQQIDRDERWIAMVLCIIFVLGIYIICRL